MSHAVKTRSEKATLAARRTVCYAALVLLSFLCLFFFYVLVINSTRTHFEIQKGFSFLPGKSLVTNLKNVLSDANIPVLTGVRNSLIVSGWSAALSVYFSALTAYGIYAYNFRFKKAAFAIILLIMTMPTQVSALGFLQLITKMGLKNSFIPLIIPSIAAPAVFFFRPSSPLCPAGTTTSSPHWCWIRQTKRPCPSSLHSSAVPTSSSSIWARSICWWPLPSCL